MSLRLKGQETKLAYSSPDGPVGSITKILNFEVNVLGEILEEEYIGDTEPEFDDISKGVEIKCDFHLNDPEVFDFFQKIIDRRNRVSDAAGKFSAVCVFKFPSGKTRKGIVNDIFFGDLPVKLGARKSYGASSLTGKARKVKWI